MFDDKKLWKDRAGRRAKDLGSYLRYIFNRHLVIVLLFLIGQRHFITRMDKNAIKRFSIRTYYGYCSRYYF